MNRLGAHMSIAGGVEQGLERAHSIDAGTVQIFTKNNNQWRAKPLEPDEIKRFEALKSDYGLDPVFAHSAYLINLASSDSSLLALSLSAFREEMLRAEALGLQYLVLHPGSHRGQGEKSGIARVSNSLNEILKSLPGCRVQILIENTAGQGDCLGFSFEQLAEILEKVGGPAKVSRLNNVKSEKWAGEPAKISKLPEGNRERWAGGPAKISRLNNAKFERWAGGPGRLGICIDTCHLFAAGYDIRTRVGYEETFRLFDRLIGIEKIKAFHLNDSKKQLGSRVDRHEHIGRGFIGKEAFRFLLNDPRFQGLPMVLETPKGEDLKEDRMNLRTLKSLIGKKK